MPSFPTSIKLLLIIGLLWSCSEKELSEPVSKPQYVKATVDGEEMVVYNTDGNIQKVRGGNYINVQALTKYDEGFEIVINELKAPVTHYLTDENDASAYINIYSTNFYPDRSAEFISGTLVIYELKQNPLRIKGSFSGKAIHSITNHWQGPYDTIEVKKGEINIEF